MASKYIQLVWCYGLEPPLRQLFEGSCFYDILTKTSVIFKFTDVDVILENKSKPLMRAIDFTNAKYGRNAISIAQAGINNDWKMRREHSSKIDTASFDSLPKISI